MSFDKIEQFLFDIMGLLIPGFLFLLIPMIIIVVAYDYSSLSIIASVGNIEQLLNHASLRNNYFYTFLIITVLSYLFGHIVKVFSIRFYDFFKIIFDYNINSSLKIIKNRIKRLVKKYCKFSLIKRFMYQHINKNILYFLNFISAIVVGLLQGLFNIIDNLIFKLFVFKTKDYDKPFISYRNVLLNYLKDKKIIPAENYNKYNYPIYKLSSIVQVDNNIKTLTHIFLAKYNFYRSLSFIIFINIFFVLYILVYKHPIHITAITFILYILFLFYFTFHYKYKRYWSLSGDEAIMALYYYYFVKH